MIFIKSFKFSLNLIVKKRERGSRDFRISGKEKAIGRGKAEG
jgi:hypothetical protein